MDDSPSVENTVPEPDDRSREWGDSTLRNASKSTYVDLSPKKIPEQDVKLALS